MTSIDSRIASRKSIITRILVNKALRMTPNYIFPAIQVKLTDLENLQPINIRLFIYKAYKSSSYKTQKNRIKIKS